MVEFDQIKKIKLNDFVKNKGNYLKDNENIKGLETLQNQINIEVKMIE